jgi:hypothetical protein
MNLQSFTLHRRSRTGSRVISPIPDRSNDVSGKLELIHTGYHGVFAPASPDRTRVVPKRRATAEMPGAPGEPSATDRQRSLTWARRLKRVFARFGVASLA